MDLTKKYQIIYADPSWSYYNDSTAKPNCTSVKGMRRPPYSVMSSREMMNLPIEKIAAENCILFIWTTDYHLVFYSRNFYCSTEYGKNIF